MRRLGPLVLLLLIIGAGCWYLLSGHKTPPQQQPLADLRPESLPAFKAEFNHSSADVRVILLLSPT
jgi:hypothetical protein